MRARGWLQLQVDTFVSGEWHWQEGARGVIVYVSESAFNVTLQEAERQQWHEEPHSTRESEKSRFTLSIEREALTGMWKKAPILTRNSTVSCG